MEGHVEPEPVSSTATTLVNSDNAPEIDAEADQDVTTKVFEFLATATPGTLGGIGVGLAAVTYFILGQLGLLLIGAFGGIALFIQWEQRHGEVGRVARAERGHEILERLLEFNRTLASGSQEESEGTKALAGRSGFDDFRPETRDALTELVDAVVRDYVRWWYSPIVPTDKFFPMAARKTLVNFISSISTHLSRKRPADAFLDFLTNSSSIVIVFFAELSGVFEALPSDSNLSAADAIHDYLASHPESNLANLLNSRQQAGKFRMVAEDLLSFLERSTYDCDPARVFLREILAGVILETTLQKCCKPEWINSWIVYLLEAGEPNLSHAIDVGMQTGPGAEIAFADIDGNVGNIALTKGNRNSFDQEKARRKDTHIHKKQLSKADEELEAMEEIKRLNQMIVDEDARRSKSSFDAPDLASPASEKQEPEHKRSATEATVGLAREFRQTPAESDIPNVDTQVSAQSDSASSRNDNIPTPLTPLSTQGSARQTPSPPRNSVSQFTSFDQIVPPAQDGADDVEEPPKPPPLTLHQATITILDEPGGRVRTKPTWDYLVQIEPATTHYPGWMIVRKYSDFERVHEVLRRIATISGVTAFVEHHADLPSWKNHTRTSLRGELERYLRDACWHQSLAESEGMKRFLERDQVGNAAGPKLGFQAIEKLGKNVFDVLTSAPMEGSKAVVGGVTGVLGNMGIGQRKPAAAPASTPPAPPPSALQDVTAASRLSISSIPRADSTVSLNGSRRPRDSMDSQRSSVVATQPGKIPPMDRRPSHDSRGGGGDTDPDNALRRSRASAQNSRANSRASSLAPAARSPSALSMNMDNLRLPPPPDAIPDDYDNPSPTSPLARPPPSPSHQDSYQSHSRSLTMPALSGRRTPPRATPAKQHAPLTEPETRVAVELLFAIINELYTLSFSSWNIRRTLLAAAKSFLLRPGNPSLLSIQAMLQASVIDANASDAGMAAHLRKLRENALPTEEEMKTWPAEMGAEEKEALRVKARRLLIRSGVPAALMGVMGQAATAEALGRLFDCLQVEEVARGLVFGVLLQGVRGVTH
ncbi:PX domain-containing protein kinase-like protein [Podospora conica]|nr:PX domain-containing protein kinase-like protein [Schizothecium conicum]